MKVGIIGSGKIGGTLTRRLSALGYEVTVANSRGPQSLTEFAEQTGAKAGTVQTAAEDADVVIIAVPLRAITDLPTSAFRGKLVVDANNYYAQRDGEIPEIIQGDISSARWVAEHLPGTRVVKAFNNIYAQHLAEYGRPAGATSRIALPVAADDGTAKRTVMSIVDDLGFDPVDGGTLDQSWRQQPNTPVYATDRDARGVREGLANARQ